MAAFLSDSFTEATATANVALTAHAPEVGGSWVLASGKFGAGSSGALTIYTGTGYVRTSIVSGFVMAYNNVMPPTENVRAVATFTRPTTSSAAQPGLAIRCDPVGNNCYYIRCTDDTTTLSKVVAGVRTTIGTSALGVANNGTAVYELIAQGSQVIVKRNGDTIITVIDTGVPNNGYVGVLTTSLGATDQLDAYEVLAVSPAEFSASGITDASAVGRAIKMATASAAGLSPSTAAGSKVMTGRGEAAGAASDVVVAAATAVGFLRSEGSSTGNFVGVTFDLTQGIAASSGLGLAAATGRAIFTAKGTSAGGSDAAAASNSLLYAEGIGRAAGGSETIGEGAATKTGRATAAGDVLTARMFASAFVEAVGEAEGFTELNGIGRDILFGQGDGEARGSSGATFLGVKIATGTGTAAGLSTALASGPVIRIGRALARAESDAEGRGSSINATRFSLRTANLASFVGAALQASAASAAGSSASNFIAGAFIQKPVPPSRTAELPALLSRTAVAIGGTSADRLVVLGPEPARIVTLPYEARIVTL